VYEIRGWAPRLLKVDGPNNRSVVVTSKNEVVFKVNAMEQQN
jgi:hypothetical protein